MIALARRHAGPWPLLLLSALAAGLLFAPGIAAVLAAWATPEYSHGPLIPIISAWLFAREVQRAPAREAGGMGPGLMVLALAVLCGVVGYLAGVGDVSAYGLILWVFAMVLLALGGRRGMAHWASVAHLLFMLPLPQVVWWEANLFLQGVSAELGVWLIGALGVPVFLEGHIIDLGVWRLEVAEACSGLRYMFPILSFSVITAVMFNGPIWAKMVLVLSAAPIAIVLNAARIGVIGVLVDAYGIEMAEGALHVMQGWVIFGGCLALLLLLSRVLWRVTGDGGPMLDLAGVDVLRAARALGQWQPRDGGLVGVVATACIAVLLVALPSVQSQVPERLPFAALPTQVGDWRGQATALAPEIETVLGADDYLDMALVGPGQAAPVNLFAAWYTDQTGGAGLHSPEVCLPAGGWEIASLEREAIAPEGMGTFDVNRAVIVKDGERRLVFYWFEQRGRRMTSAIGAKLTVLRDGVLTGRKDGALVRVMTPIAAGESETEAQARLIAVLEAAGPRLPQYIPGA